MGWRFYMAEWLHDDLDLTVETGYPQGKNMDCSMEKLR